MAGGGHQGSAGIADALKYAFPMPINFAARAILSLASADQAED
jgi:hypothetical protein